MGTATSKREENVKIDENLTVTKEERNEYKGDNEENKVPVVEEEIVPTEGIQVRSFLGAPIVRFFFDFNDDVIKCWF